MAGLRDGLQRSRGLYLPEPDRPRDAQKPISMSRSRSLPQRVSKIGFSIHSAEEQSAWKRRFGQRTTAPTETTVRTTFLLRCALLHSLSGILLAGGLTVLFLESMNGNWLWPLLLAMVVASYGMAAYWCAECFGRLPLACWVILVGDLAALVSVWLLIGPSLAFALLLPAIAVLALLLAGRREMLIIASMEAAALVVLALADLAGLPHLSFQAPTALLILLNLFGALACLGGIIYALLAVLLPSTYIGYSDHWNSAEIARVRIESDIHLRQLQESILTLQAVLGRVAAGELHARVAIKDGELAPIAARLNSLLDRQEHMFDEARQHRRLEAATGELLALLEALHRGERVGWPAPTGTQVDRILALMRAPLAPRPRITRELPVVLPPSESD